jgi:hypothetical protein
MTPATIPRKFDIQGSFPIRGDQKVKFSLWSRDPRPPWTTQKIVRSFRSFENSVRVSA